MKRINILFLLISIVLSCAAIPISNTNKIPKSGFVIVEPSGFSLDGEAYRFVGVNFWYGAILGSAGKGGDRERLNAELDFLSEHGIKNLRVLVGGDGYDGTPSRIRPTLQKEPGVYNDTILIGLDYLLNQMDLRDMKAVLYLNNSWEWSGGYSQYLEWINRDKAPNPSTDGYGAFCDYVSQFATSPEAQELFLNHIDNIISRTNTINGKRYADDTAIMAWEICNEPRAFGDETNKAAFVDWMARASERIKFNDSNHLITTGSEGMCGCEGDYNLVERIHADPNIDYITIHIWPKNWGWIGSCPTEENLVNAINNTRTYIDNHLTIATRLKKPIVLEEFGFPRDSMSFIPGSATTLRDRYFEAVFSMIDEGNIAGCNIWAWGGYGRPSSDHVLWEPWDSYTGDPAQEEQGLNSVFNIDSTTLQIIMKHIPIYGNRISSFTAPL
jgi:mannan endo-1,4-beta-mannosidase